MTEQISWISEQIEGGYCSCPKPVNGQSHLQGLGPVLILALIRDEGRTECDLWGMVKARKRMKYCSEMIGG